MFWEEFLNSGIGSSYQGSTLLNLLALRQSLQYWKTQIHSTCKKTFCLQCSNFRQGFLDKHLHLIPLNSHNILVLFSLTFKLLFTFLCILCTQVEWKNIWLTFIQEVFKKEFKREIAVDPKILSQSNLFLWHLLEVFFFRAVTLCTYTVMKKVSKKIKLQDRKGKVEKGGPSS